MHPILINHFLSVTLPLAEFFTALRRKELLQTHQSPQMTANGFTDTIFNKTTAVSKLFFLRVFYGLIC